MTFWKKRTRRPPNHAIKIGQATPRKASYVSQRTVGLMIAHYRRLFSPSGPSGIFPAPLNVQGLRDILYTMGISKDDLEIFEWNYYWDFTRLFPALNDGSFSNYRNPGLQNPSEHGHYLLLGFATALCGILRQYHEHSDLDSAPFYESLARDGFRFVAGKLIETGQDVVDESDELSIVHALIRSSAHDGKSILEHHFSNGMSLFDAGSYHASVAEWRSFLEEMLRGIWRATRSRRVEFSGFSDSPPMKDLFAFLGKAGFLTSEEQLAFSSTWGFLSAGTHPGISERDEAYLSKMLAIAFGHVALLKLERWRESGYSHF